MCDAAGGSDVGMPLTAGAHADVAAGQPAVDQVGQARRPRIARGLARARTVAEPGTRLGQQAASGVERIDHGLPVIEGGLIAQSVRRAGLGLRTFSGMSGPRRWRGTCGWEGVYAGDSPALVRIGRMRGRRGGGIRFERVELYRFGERPAALASP